MRAAQLLAVTALLGLSACGGGGGGGGEDGGGGLNCAAITGGGAQALETLNCVGCTVENRNAAIDGDLGSFATLYLPPNSSGNVALRATAQSGVVYADGTPAAVVYGIQRSDGNSLSTTQTITTYLDGVPQQTGNAGPNNGVDGGDQPVGRRAIGTNLPFDAIELTYAQSAGTADVAVRIYEFCTSVN
jgi:hypothetical protein